MAFAYRLVRIPAFDMWYVLLQYVQHGYVVDDYDYVSFFYDIVGYM